MTTTDLILTEAATLLGALPLGYLIWREARGVPHSVWWWWLAWAFAVSWFTDNLARFVDPWLVMLAYPVLQCSLIALVVIPGRAIAYFGVVSLAAVIAAIAGERGPDVFLRTIAFGSIALLSLRFTEGAVRWALVTYFGLGLLAWYVFAATLSKETWGLYQLTRVVGLGLFCYAVRKSPLGFVRG